MDKDEQHNLALELFRDKRGIHADPDLEPDFWDACLVYAKELLNWDYDLDQYERTGAPYPED
jgi:hypothetical protein